MHHLPDTYPDRISIVRSNTPGQTAASLQSGAAISDLGHIVLPSATALMEAWNRCADLRQAMQEPKHSRDRPRTRTTLSERLRTMPPAEPVRSSANARAPAWLTLVSFSIGRTFCASHSPLMSRSDPLYLFVLVVCLSAGAAGAQALLAAFARRRVDRAGRGDAVAQAHRRRAAHAWVTLAAVPQPGNIAPQLSSPRPLLSSRRRSSFSSRVFSLVVAPC